MNDGGLVPARISSRRYGGIPTEQPVSDDCSSSRSLFNSRIASYHSLHGRAGTDADMTAETVATDSVGELVVHSLEIVHM